MPGTDEGGRTPRPPIDLRALARDWRARLRDAAHFADGPRVEPVNTDDLAFRGVLLSVVLVLTAVLIAIVSLPGVVVIGSTVRGIAGRFSVELGPAELPQFAQRSVIVDRDGEVIATLAGEENRIVVPLEDVPERTQQAVLAIEDAKFYSHHGVDLAGLMRALFANVRAGGVREGGSTITQQLVKNTLVGTERTLDRKIREARLAVELEKRMTKKEILQLYLNEAYFGGGVYGIGTAAEYYFDKAVKDLTLAEGALLAGIVKAPETYQPLENPEGARRRRALVLQRMVDEGFITPEQAERANRAKLPRKAHRLPETKVPYFVEFVKSQIMDDPRFGETRSERAQAIFAAGLRIETTLDLDMQRAAKKAVDGVLDRKDDPASALVSIDVETGAVRAMVGGRNFDEEKYNLATQGKRQPGSTFKTMALVAALLDGLSPTLTYDTPSPLEIKDPGTGKTIKVNNYDEKSRGFIDMRQATEQSVNTYYMQLMQKVGPQKVVEAAKKLGIRSPLKPVLSLALGTEVVSPYELASAYATLANGGVYCRPYAITRVTDPHGEEILRARPDCEQRISKDTAAMATSILKGVIDRGSGRRNAQIGRPAAGKTGTTDDYVDSWFAGYTRQLSTVVWMGFPETNDRPLKNIHGLAQVFGGSLPAQIWARFMRAAHSGLPSLGFPAPPAIATTEVPDVVGKPLAEARELLEEAGFTVASEEVPSGAKAGTVVEQDPAGGTKAGAGSVVRLKVSDGEGEEPDDEETPTPSPSPSPTSSPKPSPSPSGKPSKKG